MDADEIQPLTAAAVSRLLQSRQAADRDSADPGKRSTARWAFPGAVEMWVPGPDGAERHVLGTCHNLTERGVGVRCDDPIEPGLTMAIAVHQPEVSFHGRGTVRHCSLRGKGYLVGFEFRFDDA